MVPKIHHGIGLLSLIAGMASVGCYQGDIEGTAEATNNVLREVHVSATKRILFIDEGNGNVGVAEVSRMGEAPIVTTMIQQTAATPLEIFLATARDIDDVPAILVENHRDIAAMQGREDLEPRRHEAPVGMLETLAWDQDDGTITCNAAGWEGASGAWGDPIDSWDNIFTNSTDPLTNNTTYPHTKTVTQDVAWNVGSGSFHTHGACLSSDSGADNKINLTVQVGINGTPTPKDLLEAGNDNWVMFTDYISINGTQTISKVTNVGNSSATFRHSAAAWVPFPG